MPSLEQLRKGLLRPRIAVMTLRRELMYRRTGNRYNTEGVDVFEEDWDNLLILDACRYDVFEQHSDLEGSLESRISRGGATVEWLRGNFQGRDLRDVVYVTANPQYYRYRDKLDTEFHDVWHIWRDDWDDEIKTVPPERTADRAREAISEFPDKRLLVHFNQPHGPFLGETGRRYTFGPGNKPMSERNWLDDLRIRLETERIPHDAWWDAYVETFEIVEDAVEELLPELPGRTVVSSDHGKLLGERGSPIPFRLYNHLMGYYHEKLVTVPWLVHESGKRRETTVGTPTTDDAKVDSRTVSDRLSDLGYVSG